MKGMSLSLETIVLLVIMAIVLSALLMFFTGIFNPSKSKVDIMRNTQTYCMKYISYDSNCDSAVITDVFKGQASSILGTRRFEDAKQGLNGILDNICGQPKNEPYCGQAFTGKSAQVAISCIQQCCAGYCGKQPTPQTSAP
jgi:hypothetical protein